MKDLALEALRRAIDEMWCRVAEGAQPEKIREQKEKVRIAREVYDAMCLEADSPAP